MEVEINYQQWPTTPNLRATKSSVRTLEIG
jgi:hypothetical protein